MKPKPFKDGDEVMVVGRPWWGVVKVNACPRNPRPDQLIEVTVTDPDSVHPDMDTWVKYSDLMKPEEAKLLNAINPEEGL